MGLLLGAFGARPQANSSWGPLDNRWYSDEPYLDPASGFMAGGFSVSADSLYRCSVVMGAIGFKQKAVSMCTPASVIRSEGKKRTPEPDHYAQIVLRDPTSWLTDVRWMKLNMAWVTLWGNSYNRILPTRESWAGILWPLHPSRVRVLGQRNDGTVLYEYRHPAPFGGGEERLETFGQEECLHFRNTITFDGVSGAKIYQLIRNVVNIALLAEAHIGTTLKKGARLAGIIVPEAPLTVEQRKTLRESWDETFGGSNTSGTVGSLPYGVKFQPISSDNRNAQMTELTDQMVGVILRALGVPGVAAGYGEKTATYAAADAYFTEGVVRYTILPDLMDWEAECSKALLVRGDGRSIKFNPEALLRAVAKERAAIHFQATGRPWMTPNEVRAIEDLNPIEDDPTMDEVAMPVNQQTPATLEQQQEADAAAMPKPGAPMPAEDEPDAGAAGAASARRFVVDAAARVLRREVATIADGGGRRGLIEKHGKDAAAFRAAVTEFYAGHAGYVVEQLHVSVPAAQAYCAEQLAKLASSTAVVLGMWDQYVRASEIDGRARGPIERLVALVGAAE